jgi:hypothetical protein
MSPFRKLLLVGLSVFALDAMQACAADDLNPQPLPPDDRGGSLGDPPGSDNGGGGADPTSPAPGSDASADGGDASDGGAD